MKHFATPRNLATHQANTPVCRAWLDAGALQQYHGRRLLMPVAEVTCDFDLSTVTGTLLDGVLNPAGTACLECNKDFSSPSCLHRHYRTSVACDRMRAKRLIDALDTALQAPPDVPGVCNWDERHPAPSAYERPGCVSL